MNKSHCHWRPSVERRAGSEDPRTARLPQDDTKWRCPARFPSNELPSVSANGGREASLFYTSL